MTCKNNRDHMIITKRLRNSNRYSHIVYFYLYQIKERLDLRKETGWGGGVLGRKVFIKTGLKRH